MIKHVVCHKYKDKREAVRIAAMLNGLMGKVPSLISMEAGVNELESARAYDLVLTAVFEDMEGLDAYQNHPEHVKVRDYIHTVMESAVSVDYTF